MLPGLLTVALAVTVRAELTVDITHGVEGAMPIAVVPFGQAEPAGDDLARVVAADLESSGRFALLPDARMPERPVPPDPVNFPAWQSAGQEHVVIGRVTPGTADAPHAAEYLLYDAIRGNQLLAERIPFKASEARHTAHRIADRIYQQLTGERGVFNTRIAYVTALGSGKNRTYKLTVADADGHDAREVMSSPEPIMSPAWSPDGKRMAYVSFENRAAAVFVQNLATGERRKVSGAPGINGAPAWSPDGSTLALTLSKDGSPDIYTLDLVSGSLRRLTRDDSIETEANWSPDGRSLVITSDRGGKPQLYLLPIHGGEPQRLTYEGEYNARGVFAPDGRSLALVHGGAGGFRIAVLDLGSRDLKVLSSGPLDEAPAFAPNGRMVLYLRKDAAGEPLAWVSTDGKTQRKLPVRGGDVRGVAWSP
jgi:TolB protein